MCRLPFLCSLFIPFLFLFATSGFCSDAPFELEEQLDAIERELHSLSIGEDSLGGSTVCSCPEELAQGDGTLGMFWGFFYICGPSKEYIEDLEQQIADLEAEIERREEAGEETRELEQQLRNLEFKLRRATARGATRSGYILLNAPVCLPLEDAEAWCEAEAGRKSTKEVTCDFFPDWVPLCGGNE